MATFTQLLNQAMEKKKIGVRFLEREIIERYGADKMISRSLISDYRLGKRAPTYEGALIIAEILGINKTEFLVAAYELKSNIRRNTEHSRFKEFCKKHKINVD